MDEDVDILSRGNSLSLGEEEGRINSILSPVVARLIAKHACTICLTKRVDTCSELAIPTAVSAHVHGNALTALNYWEIIIRRIAENGTALLKLVCIVNLGISGS